MYTILRCCFFLTIIINFPLGFPEGVHYSTQSGSTSPLVQWDLGSPTNGILSHSTIGTNLISIPVLVVVSPQGQQLVLNELHDLHPGCTRMKALARSYVRWPQMNAAIEEVVKEWKNCQESRPFPAVAPLHPWE